MGVGNGSIKAPPQLSENHAFTAKKSRGGGLLKTSKTHNDKGKLYIERLAKYRCGFLVLNKIID